MSAPLRLAMWSGPRNVSTALMRSFDSRPDSVVCDEPLYAHYLKLTGLDHPIAEQVVQKHESDWEKVVDWLTGPPPGNAQVFYQKHMSHHLLPEIGRSWLADLENVFLIRDPRQMLTSLLQILPEPKLPDTGLPQQLELFEEEHERRGQVPLVLDSADLLRDPEAHLRALCEALGIEFFPTMLQWEAGLRETDGCWAEAWYGNALESTGFSPFKPKTERVPDSMHELEAQCLALYDTLHPHRIQA